MEYNFKINITELTEHPFPLISATVLKDNVIISKKAWLNKPYDQDKLGNIIHEITDEMFPREEEKKPSSPTKTQRGRSK